MNDTNWTKYRRVLHAVEMGCDKPSEIKERFGNNGQYILTQLLKMGCVIKVSKGIYKKIQDLPFTNQS